MKLIGYFFLLIAFAIPANASPPNLEPLDQVFKRFNDDFINQSEYILDFLEENLSPPENDKTSELIEILRLYLHRIKTENIPAFQRILRGDSDESIIYWLSRLETNIGGVRRAVDRIIIINARSNKIKINDSFYEKIEHYWEQEEYFIWRFKYEANRNNN